MTRAAWNTTRFAERERAHGTCERCLAPLAYSRFCVVANGRGFLVLCKGCCTAHYAPLLRARRLAIRHRHQVPLEVAS